MQDTQKPGVTPTGMGSFSESPKPNGEVSSKKSQIKPEDLLLFGTGDECVTSTFTVERLFSLKQRKWLKPYRTEVYGLDYHILPGRYLLISADVHRRKDEVMKWVIRVIRIYKAEDGSVKEDIEKEVQWITPIPEEERTVPILRDVQNPSFHGHSKVPYDKIYDEQEVSQLLEGGVDPALGEYLE